MILIITVLAFLSILFFATNDVEASLSDLENIKPADPNRPETESPTTDSTEPDTNSRTQDEAESTQDEAESGVANTQLYQTEENYCNDNVIDDITFQGYAVKVGTNNPDRLYRTPNKDLILGLGGNDLIIGSGDGDIICGGTGDVYLLGESYREIILRQPGSPGNDVIFGQDGKDYIIGGLGNDFLLGGSGDYSIDGAQGNYNDDDDVNDFMDGGRCNDYCEDIALKTFVNCEFEDDGIIK
jgi:Ca2+-binding RTX toxin-like protein